MKWEKLVQKTEKELREIFAKFEKDLEKLNELRKNCQYIEEIFSIPATYPKCNHPKSRDKVCYDLEGCPRFR